MLCLVFWDFQAPGSSYGQAEPAELLTSKSLNVCASIPKHMPTETLMGMTGLDCVGLLFCELSQLRKQAVAEVKAKYGLHETQYRNMALVGFANASTVENKGRLKELMQAEQVPGSPGSCHEWKNQSAFSQRNQRITAVTQPCVLRGGLTRQRRMGKRCLWTTGSLRTVQVHLPCSMLSIDLCRMQLAQGDTPPNNADTQMKQNHRNY